MSKILKYKPFPGLQIKCQACGKLIHKNSKINGDCNHPIDRQVYKAVIVIPNSGGKRTTKNLSSRNYNDAILELSEFKSQAIKQEPKTFFKPKAQNKTVAECIQLYIDFISDVNIPDHLKKMNTKSHISQQTSLFMLFMRFLKSNGENVVTFEIDKIDDFLVGKYHTYILSNDYSNSTYNHAMRIMKSLFEYLIANKYKLSNPFKGVKKRAEPSTNASVSAKDFNDLLDVIQPNDVHIKVGNTRRNMYRDYLKNLFKLKVFTGRRNEEVALMKWSWIGYEDKMPIYIKCPNIKVNKQKNSVREVELEYDYVPVAEELRELLFEMGLDKNKGCDDYIVAPQVNNRKDLMDKASRSYSFFFKKLGRPYKSEFNFLRKTYITQYEIFERSLGISLVREHSNKHITNKHYINDIDVARFVSGSKFRIFPKVENTKVHPNMHPIKNKSTYIL